MLGKGWKKDIREGWRLRSQQIKPNWGRTKRNVSPSKITKAIEIYAVSHKWLESILCQY